MGRHRSPSYDSPSPERTRTQKNGKRSLTDLLEANQRSPSSSPDRSRNRDVGRQRGNRRSPSDDRRNRRRDSGSPERNRRRESGSPQRRPRGNQSPNRRNSKSPERQPRGNRSPDRRDRGRRSPDRRDRGFRSPDRGYNRGPQRGGRGGGRGGGQRYQKREPEVRPPNRSLFIRPIGPDVIGDEIMPHFIPFGEIRDIHIPLDFHTQKPRGFAYIEFEEVTDAEQAQANLQDLVLGGKEISVQFAFGDRKTPGQMKGQKEAVHLLAEIKEIQMKYRRQQQEKRRRSRERRKAAGLPATTSDEDTSDEEIIMPERPNQRKRGLFEDDKPKKTMYRRRSPFRGGNARGRADFR